MRGLHGKTFIIAGGATGIGAGTANRLAVEGAYVAIGDVNITAARMTVDAINAKGGRAIAVEFDFADEHSVSDLVDTTLREFGHVDGLYNVGADLSAEVNGRDLTVLNTGLDIWWRTLNVNLLGYVRTIRAVLPHLRAHGAGSIVNTSSGGSLGVDPMHVAYNASKAAVNQLTRHVANNYGKEGIRCNCVMPGLVWGETQENQPQLAGLQDMFIASAKTTRVGRASDVAGIVALLLSDEGEWINGQTWYIGGAAHMRQ
ncbi:NAD(P)-dependent dehydrogenase (short-subunit alcohol dehydrogenase family) [Mycobacterium sp. MAA66]|uniref:SDR family NAD(P)-dependent oxidoreductase n=1 Tax=Mycobacterium sp. MAA66 TaxID=3156297 RepID=UPI00351456B7